MKYNTGAVIFVAALFLSVSGQCLAQELPESVIRFIESECENGTADAGQMEQYFLELMRNPVNLNTASRAELSSLILLNRFMVESLIDYRKEYGQIVSFAELSLIDGFSEEIVAGLSPFVTLGDRSGTSPLYGKNDTAVSAMKKLRLLPIRNSAILKSHATFAKEKKETFGTPFYRYARYHISFGSIIEAGFTLESDAGEKGFPDFYSVTVGVNDLPLSGNGDYKLDRLVIGDYSLRFGQGLALWSGFSMSSLSTPSSVLRIPGGIRSYTSSGESGFYRGLAATFRFPHGFQSSVFFSSVKHDATIDGYSFITKPDGGLHNTPKLLASKGNLRETAGGANISWQNSFLRLGITAVLYGYDKKDGRRKSYYNSHLRYDGLWCNVAADFLLSFRGIRIFGETAIDRQGHFAIIAGIDSPLSSGLEVSLICRYYDSHYIANHAGAYSNTSCNNEAGVSAVISYIPDRKLSLSANTAYTHYPFHRYGVKGPSDVFKSAIDCDWTIASRHSLYLKLSGSFDNGRKKDVLRLRCEYIWSLPWGMEMATRIEGSKCANNFGGLFFQELRYNAPESKFRVSFRATAFSAKEWDTRIYCYERDIPGMFSVPAYYGKGTGLYAVATYKPVKWFSISFKCSGTLYENSAKDNLKLNCLLSFSF